MTFTPRTLIARNDESGSPNALFDFAYFDSIKKRAYTDVIGQHSADRALLLIWPNDPDPVDNVQFGIDGGCDGTQPVGYATVSVRIRRQGVRMT